MTVEDRDGLHTEGSEPDLRQRVLGGALVPARRAVADLLEGVERYLAHLERRIQELDRKGDPAD